MGCLIYAKAINQFYGLILLGTTRNPDLSQRRQRVRHFYTVIKKYRSGFYTFVRFFYVNIYNTIFFIAVSMLPTIFFHSLQIWILFYELDQNYDYNIEHIIYNIIILKMVKILVAKFAFYNY